MSLNEKVLKQDLATSIDTGSIAETEDGQTPRNQLQRGLKARHIQMIALGGTIGTGLFMSSGKAISNGGPGGALVGYGIVGILVYFVMMSLGEMATYMPVHGSFGHFAGRFVDPSLGFMVSVLYWCNWAVGVAVELTGVAMIMEYWITSVNSVVWSIICLVILVIINVFAVKGYGEIEYWVSFIKILTIVAFVIIGICVDTGALGGDHIGVRNFHLDGGAFPNGFLGVFNVFITAAFSYNGVEMVGISAGESQNPHKTIPAAVKQVFVRIVLFYILSMLMIGLCIPYNDPNLLDGASNVAVSPFTLVFRLAGAQSAADIINAIILVTMISAGNSGVYSSSRTLMRLSEDGYVPKFFSRVNRFGVPIYAVLTSCFVGCLAFLTSFIGSGVVFTWLTRLTSLAGLITWISISITHIRFRMGLAAQGRALSTLPYVAPLYPYADLFVIVIGSIVVFGQGYATFIAPIKGAEVVGSYIGLILAVVLYVGHKVIRRPAFIKAEDMDFETGTLKVPANGLQVDDDDDASDLNAPLWKRWFNKLVAILA
ncbi:hypothetical protein DM01DRAFT_1336791 [Hesseltinella vesiculosa]|uniref:Amino acid permease/ SLC12A domain-containing protein n=1 Tax=Hesseltinella vesiculosa TaxID=101127 RepID=A0A1X2GFA1_9FUNG|nr:hypothetical protein DM01DRAFT_1336791 [Hesseltinella vesiculosa]